MNKYDIKKLVRDKLIEIHALGELDSCIYITDEESKQKLEDFFEGLKEIIEILS